MKKQLTNKTIYEPNKGVKITVVNKPVFDQELGQLAGYDVGVTIKHRRTLYTQELNFNGK